MPPIPIHKNAPIAPSTAAKADGVTPLTASSDNSGNAANPPPTRTTPAYAPATTTQSVSSPSAPQPGARPAASTAGSMAGYDGGGTPAPPQPGPTATVVTTETRQAAQQPPPPQLSHPPPSDSMLAGRSTATSTTASKPGPTTLNYGPAASPFQTSDAGNAVPQPTRTSLEHPPGYVQAPDNAPYTAGGGIGGPSGAGEGEGVGAQAWQMLSKAGEALKKGEESVWRAVNNKNGGGF